MGCHPVRQSPSCPGLRVHHVMVPSVWLSVFPHMTFCRCSGSWSVLLLVCVSKSVFWLVKCSDTVPLCTGSIHVFHCCCSRVFQWNCLAAFSACFKVL
ncbi:hypothetical protein [Cutibacterium phage vB_CutS_PA1]|nr:hypothetical protein [Cutibacterium phage vB_CutS_PA1]